MPDTTGFLIRQLRREEAANARAFVEKNDEQACSLSHSFFIHHTKTIFVCTDNAGVWKGLLVSYLSPLEKNIAIIETLVVSVESRKQGNATHLLEVCWQMGYFDP